MSADVYPTLRTFRDGYMKTQISNGPAMIREYYTIAPAVVAAINTRDDAAEIHDWIYRDLVLPTVRLIQYGNNARALDHYAGFVLSLYGSDFINNPVPERRQAKIV